MKIYFLRHGQSEANVHKLHGGPHYELTDLGRVQAAAVAPLLAPIQFEAVYSSDYPRAIQTAKLAVPGQPIHQTPLLREIQVGDLTGMTPAECEAKWGQIYVRSRAAMDYSYFGGESFIHLGQRMGTFLNQIAQEHTGNVLAVCHTHAISSGLNYLFGSKDNEWAMMDNCGISVLEYTNGAWNLLHWNVTATPTL